MATQAYYDWVDVGRPYRLATPIAELKALARRHGIGFLGDIGSDDARHLQAAYPEDHCPFSYTAWPVPLPGYVVCAIDLANEKGLGEALLRDARAGRAPWLKYLNFAGRNYSVRRGWEPVWNADAHLHISIRSDWTDRSIGDYDPLTEDDMAGEGPAILALLLDGKSPTGVQTSGGGVPRVAVYRELYDAQTRLARLESKLDSVTATLATLAQLAAGEGDLDTAAVLARIDERAEQDAARDAAHAEQVRALTAQLTQAANERDTLNRRLADALAGNQPAG